MNAKEQAAMGELRSLLGRTPSSASQRRSFIVRLTQLLDSFRPALLQDVVIDYVLQAMSSSPSLAAINFAPTDRWLSDLVMGREVPQLALVTTIDLGERSQRPALLTKLLRADGFKRLNHLRLRGWRLDTTCLEGLDDTSTSVAFDRLELEQCICAPAWSEALGHWAGLAHVRELKLPGAALSEAFAHALASRPALKLQHLSIDGAGYSAQALRTLLEASWIEGLRALHLDARRAQYYQRPDYDHLLALATCERLTGLNALSLRGVSLRPESARALSRSPALDALVSLDLASCNIIGARWVEALFEGPALLNIRELNLSDCDLSGADLVELMDLAQLSSLRKLDLSFNDLLSGADELPWLYNEHHPMTSAWVRQHLFGDRADVEVIYVP